MEDAFPDVQKLSEHHQSISELESCVKSGQCTICPVFWDSVQQHDLKRNTNAKQGDNKLYVVINLQGVDKLIQSTITEKSLPVTSHGEVIWICERLPSSTMNPIGCVSVFTSNSKSTRKKIFLDVQLF
jgi:hypothetical protein